MLRKVARKRSDKRHSKRPTRNELERAFRAFHSANPEVYVLFKKYARQAARAGRKNFGVAMIWERMRWHTLVETQGDSYKLNNNHRAYYARMFMEEHPQHAGFFRTRRVKNEAHD